MIQKYTIGRDPSNNIVVAHPTVSGYHADLIIDDSMGYPQYTFIDHSTNGTLINGQLLKNASCFVVYNDTIVLAGSVMFDWSVLNSSNFAVPHSETAVFTPGAAPQPVPGNGGYAPGNGGYASGYQQPSRSRDVTFVGALKNFFQKYFDFSSRATRKEYWFVFLWMMIFNTAISILITLVLSLSVGSLAIDFDEGVVGFLMGMGWISIVWMLFELALFIPSLSLLVRRIHDTGKSGLWLLMLLVPIANIVFFFIWTLTPSEPRANKWGRY